MKSGTCTHIPILFLRHHKPVLRLGEGAFSDVVLHALLEENGILLWENLGAFGLVPGSVLRNIWSNQDVSKKLGQGYPRTAKTGSLLDITWKQAVPIDSAVVRSLLLATREEKSGKPHPATNPAGEDHPEEP